MALPAILGAGLASAIVAGLASGASQIVLKVLATLGFGYATYLGADLLATQSETQVLQMLSALPPTSVQLMGVLKVGTCIKIMFSAMVMRLTLLGMNEGKIRKFGAIAGQQS